MSRKLETGVYCIFNVVTKKRYVGSAAISLKYRWRTHLRGLRNGCHHSSKLQAAWNQYGESAFEFIVLIRCKPPRCIKQEQAFIDIYDSFRKGYNCLPKAGSVLGLIHSKASRKKISINTKKGMTKEVRAKLSLSLTGHKQSAKTRAKRKIKMKKEWVRRKQVGWKMSKSSIEKMAASKRGKKHSKKAIENMRKAQLGRKHPPEVRRKISEARKGMKFSAETRAKISAITKAQPRKNGRFSTTKEITNENEKVTGSKAKRK